MASLFQRKIAIPQLPAPAALQAADGVALLRVPNAPAAPAAASLLPAANSVAPAVTPATLRVAMLSIMADQGPLSAGTPLTLIELMAAWDACGLRADDLSSALNESITDQIVEFHGDGTKSTVTLTAAGQAWLRSAWASGEFMKQRRILDFIRHRPHAAGAAEPPHFRERRTN